MFIPYKSFNFKEETVALIEQAVNFIDDYERQGYTLTLRQLYYKFVSSDLIENTEKSYKRLGSIITDARLAGMISWTSIEDRNRTCRTYAFDDDPQEALNGIEYQIALDFWERQEYYVEAWVEKDALVGVLERPCLLYQVPFMACKGYLSASEAWRAGQRFAKAANNGKKCVLIHLGDHDPSGIDMTRDNSDRLDLFASEAYVDVRRLALNMPQIETHKPPPNPAKITDSRADGYIKKYGRSSWELDALEPSMIDKLVTKEIKKLIDPDIWAECQQEQDEKRALLEKIYDRWDDVRPFLEKLK